MVRLSSITSGSQTILNIIRGGRARKKKLIILAIVLIIGLVVGAIVLFKQMSTAAAERVVTAYSSLRQCLLGEPLKEGELASRRFRAIQLAAISLAEIPQAPGKEEPWPLRCVKYGHQLNEGLKQTSQAKEGAKDLAYWADKLATALKQKGAVAQDLSEMVDQTFEQAKKENMKTTLVAAVPEPPAPIVALDIDELRKTKGLADQPIDFKNVHGEPHPGAAVRFIVNDEQLANSPALCVAEAGAESLNCAKLPADVAKSTQGGLRLLGTVAAKAKPLVFAGVRGADGVFVSDTGEKIGALASCGGYVAADGFAAVLGCDDKSGRLSLLRRTKAGSRAMPAPVSTGFKLKLADPSRDAAMLWDHLLFVGTNPKKEVWLAASQVKTKGPATSALTEAGPLPGTNAATAGSGTGSRIAGCRSGGTVVAKVEHGPNSYMSFMLGSGWSKPLKVLAAGGELSCRKGHATITNLQPGPSGSPLNTAISQHRCTPESCEHTNLKLKELLKGQHGLAPTALSAAGDLGGKLLFIWGAGQRGGLRLRVGPPAQVATVKDVVLFDDLIKDGKLQNASALIDMRVFVRSSFALLLLNTKSGVYAMSITPEGKATPLKVEWKG